MNQRQSSSTLNPVQIHLLEMFSFNRRKESLNELKELLFEFYRKKVDKEAAILWEKYELNDTKIEEMLHSHNRTPYK
jgi:hypothetical protein